MAFKLTSDDPHADIVPYHQGCEQRTINKHHFEGMAVRKILSWFGKV
jgi:hypothetical protein